MPNNQRAHSIRQTRERLQRSRAEMLALARELKGEGTPSTLAFPRSLLMRALLSNGGRVMLGGAALGLGLLRPRLLVALWRLAPLTPLLRGALNRYLVRRILR
jgi:hypothetical protein